MLYQQALRSTDKESLACATIHHNIGGILHAQGNFAAAEEPARKAWDISRRLLGERAENRGRAGRVRYDDAAHCERGLSLTQISTGESLARARGKPG